MSDMDERGYVTQADMEHELEEIVTESMTRPLTPDEAHALAFHCGIRFIKPWSHHA